ncbi:sugar phosphate isomerase/epimerase [Paenibacillus sp. CC-CFT747]|nr:sugar phosphate isomerase/epimerase [Paenibacillus sp. CC-CFT747]
MKLGIITPRTEQGFKTAAEFELDFVEYAFSDGREGEKTYPDTEEFLGNVPRIKGWIRSYGVGLQSVGRWGQQRWEGNGKLVEPELAKCLEMIDAASELECPNFVVGCNEIEGLSFEENCGHAVEFFSRLVDYASPKGVRISVYNCHWTNFVDQAGAWEAVLGEIPELGIKFDPSHSRYAGRDYLKEARDWGGRFGHVHLKGSLIIDGERFDDPPAGLDQTDWPSLLSVLYAHRYDGGLSIEPHSSVWNGELGRKGIRFTGDYMRKLIL